MKSESVEEELSDGVYAVERLGGRLLQPMEYQLPGLTSSRWLIVAEKVGRTPQEYPREPGTPSRRPLLG